MSDEERIRQAIEQFATQVDARAWPDVRKALADEVDLDYTSVAGGEPARVKADDIVAGWRQAFARYASTKHNFSNVRATVQGDTAQAFFTGQATHMKTNGERWSCGGDYDYRFVRTPAGWSITAATFSMTWEQGIR